MGQEQQITKFLEEAPGCIWTQKDIATTLEINQGLVSQIFKKLMNEGELLLFDTHTANFLGPSKFYEYIG